MRTTNRETYEFSISSSEHDNAAVSIDPSNRANRPLYVQWGLFFAERLALGGVPARREAWGLGDIRAV